MHNTKLNYKVQLQKTLIIGGVLRFFFLFLVIVVFQDTISPYIMADDIRYEDVASKYLLYANSILDYNAAAIVGADDYLEIFWPYVMCVFAKLFHTEFGGRIVNCLLSTYCIYLVYNLTKLISLKEITALKAAKLFAYLPYPWIICCFPLKDIFLTTVVLFVFTIFIKFQQGIKIPIIHIIISILLLIAVSFTRGAVTEFLGLVGLSFFIKSLIDKKKTNYAIIAGLLGLVILLFIWGSIMDSFEQKINDYKTEEYISTGFLQYIQINKLTDLWKLPATYFFAMIQPMIMSIFTPDWSDWSYFLRLLNLTAYPIAFGNIIYAFTKKYNKFFWYTSFLMYASVFSLSLGIYRHYLFLYPFLMVNYACNQSMKKPYTKNIVQIGSILMYIIIFIISLKK